MVSALIVYVTCFAGNICQWFRRFTSSHAATNSTACAEVMGTIKPPGRFQGARSRIAHDITSGALSNRIS